jgi:adenylate cyclase
MFRTVRAKLFGLVALTGGSAVVALLVLGWILQRQLVDLVDDRMPQALAGLEVELADDLHDVEAQVHTLETATEVREAWLRGQRDPLRDELHLLHEYHPLIGLAVFDTDGAILAQHGLSEVPVRASQISGIPSSDGMPDLPTAGTVIPQGCAPAPTQAPPAYVMARSLGGLGWVLACLPLDATFLEHTAAKLGVELALVDTDGGGLCAHTGGFPPEVADHDAGSSLVSTAEGRTWAVDRLGLGELVGDPRYAVVAALDVTDIRALVFRDLGAAAGAILVLCLLGMMIGGRVARTLSGAIARIRGAMQDVSQGQYTQVEGMRTGDEMEELAAGFNHMVEGLRERDNLRQTFGKYMTQTVMEHLLAGKVELGGETLQVTILFSDIRSFSTISERMEAHALVSLLNEYFAEMVAIVMQEDGVVDKFIGDAMMAVFGAPVPKADDATRAVRAAVRMRRALAALNEKLERRGLPAIRAGIGIHTGEVVAGNIGSEARMEYTVIGDAVNVAARLETATKDLGEDIVVSDGTRAQAGDTFAFRPLGELPVKGRKQPVRAFAVGDRAEPDGSGG